MDTQNGGLQKVISFKLWLLLEVSMFILDTSFSLSANSSQVSHFCEVLQDFSRHPMNQLGIYKVVGFSRHSPSPIYGEKIAR